MLAVIGTNDGMVVEFECFVKCVTVRLVVKQSTVITWLRTKLSFCALKFSLRCLRGPGTLRKKEQNKNFQFSK